MSVAFTNSEEDFPDVDSFNAVHNKDLETHYREQIEIIKKALAENWPIKSLMEAFPSNLVIVLGMNCSGVNIANLSTEIIQELTW